MIPGSAGKPEGIIDKDNGTGQGEHAQRTAQALEEQLHGRGEQVADGRMVGVQNFVCSVEGRFLVFNQPDPAQEPDQAGGKLTDECTPESSQQYQRNHAEIDDPANTDCPDDAAKLLINKGTVEQQEEQAEQGNHKLIGDEPDGDRGGAVSYGNTGLAERIDLHRLTAAGTGGDITVKETDQRDAEYGPEVQTEPLLFQAVPGTQRIKEGIGGPAKQETGNPSGIQAAEGIPGVSQFGIAESNTEDGDKGENDEQYAENTLQLLIHADVSFLHNYIPIILSGFHSSVQLRGWMTAFQTAGCMVKYGQFRKRTTGDETFESCTV